MSSKSDHKYKIVSLFSGCGGLDLGFVGRFDFLGRKYPKRRFEIAWANDIDETSSLTFNRYFNHEMVVGDIWKILDDNAIPRRADVVLGGFPCQDFSFSGKRRGFKSDRGQLYRGMVETVRRTKPLVFVAENVKGLLSMDGGKAIETIEKDFADLGYHISTKLYQAAEYGVPQSRERIFIVGTDKKNGLPKFEHNLKTPLVGRKKWVKLRKAIGDLEKMSEGAMPNHYWSKAKMFKGTQGNILVSPDKIGPAMRAEHHGNIEWHWNGKRRLSAREAARIQSFPDDFEFFPSTSQAYRQIGNAVPPVLAWYIAGDIQRFLDNNLRHGVSKTQQWRKKETIRKPIRKGGEQHAQENARRYVSKRA